MRDKLIELIGQIVIPYWAELIADHLISNGVTFADVPDNNVGKWVPVSEGLPEIYVHVLVQTPGEKPFATVHEGWRNPYGGGMPMGSQENLTKLPTGCLCLSRQRRKSHND